MFAINETAPTGKIRRFLYYAILGFIASLFLKDTPVITNFFMAAIFIMAWFNKTISYKLLANGFSKNKVNIGLILFFIYQFGSVLFSSDKLTGLDILRVRLSLFIMPVAFCLIDFEQKTWRKILTFYAMAAVIASFAGFVNGARMAVIEHNAGYLYNDNITYLLIGKQAAYFSLYVDMAVFIIIYLLRFKEEYSKRFKVILYISLGWLLFMNYMIASTMSTISLALILLSLVIFQIAGKKKYLEGFILLSGLVVGVFILYTIFPKSLVRFQRLANTDYTYNNTNPENHFDAADNPNEWSSASTRLALWNCGREIWLSHPITGTGLGDIRSALKQKYTEKQFWSALNTRRNLHNQYLDILVSMGILGFLVFLITFIIYPVKVFITQSQTLALCVYVCFAICFLTENLFDRYQGAVFIALILPMAAKVFDKQKSPAIDYQQDTF